MRGWIRESLADGGWKFLNEAAYGEMVEKLAAIYEELPVQLIHRDVHFGNFLFDGETFSGYIDFDLSQRNVRIFDLCYFLLGLLADEEMGVSRDEWFHIAERTFCGYQEKLSLSDGEKRAAALVMECIELLFVAYFEKEGEERLAARAFELFSFVRENEARLRGSVG